MANELSSATYALLDAKVKEAQRDDADSIKTQQFKRKCFDLPDQPGEEPGEWTTSTLTYIAGEANTSKDRSHDAFRDAAVALLVHQTRFRDNEELQEQFPQQKSHYPDDPWWMGGEAESNMPLYDEEIKSEEDAGISPTIPDLPAMGFSMTVGSIQVAPAPEIPLEEVPPPPLDSTAP